MACRLCSKSEDPPNFLSETRCAFDNVGRFTTDNWQCRSMLRLREMSGENRLYNDDHSATIVTVDYDNIMFMMLSWYKNRGRTDNCLVWDGGDWRSPYVGEIDGILARLGIVDSEP